MLKLAVPALFLALLSSCTEPCAVCDDAMARARQDCVDFAARQCNGEICVPTSTTLAQLGVRYQKSQFLENCIMGLRPRYEQCVFEFCDR